LRSRTGAYRSFLLTSGSTENNKPDSVECLGIPCDAYRMAIMV
jgi:hypothetical protein